MPLPRMDLERPAAFPMGGCRALAACVVREGSLKAVGLATQRRLQMSILAWIVVGIVAGLLARLVVPGEGPGGLLGDLIIGVVGALIGGWIFHALGYAGATGMNLWSIFVAFVGAVVLLLILRAVTWRRVAY